MLSNPATWILFSFIIFIACTFKKILAAIRNMLDSYITDIKEHSTKLESDMEKAEKDLVSVKKTAKSVDNEIKLAVQAAAAKALEMRQNYREAREASTEQINAQYDKDIAIEVKFEQKLVVKRLGHHIADELRKTFQSNGFDNSQINLDYLDFKKLFYDSKK